MSDTTTPTLTDAPADLVRRARHYATQAHQRIDHRRKGTGQPYELHLKAVHEMVSSVTTDPATNAAAWLHDVVEDTTVTIGDVRREFGDAVAQLVGELTDVSRPGDGNRAVRKAIDRRHLASASPAAQTVKLADLTDNARDIARHQPAFAPVYLQEMAALLQVLQAGNARLYRRAWTLCRREAARLGVALRPATEPGLDDEQPSRLGQIAGERTMRHFRETFTAADIAGRLPSFDVSATQRSIAEALRRLDEPVALMRRGGLGVAWVPAAELQDIDEPPQVHLFRAGQVVAPHAPLSDVVEVLSRHDYCFIGQFDEVVGAIGRGDMGKPLVRMWLFGIVTMVELALTERIRRDFPNHSWRAFLSTSRLAKAEALREERQRLNQRADLIDCLQFGDKAAIVLADEATLAQFGFAGRAAARERFQQLQSLRNNLAHAQDIVVADWAQITLLARDVARFSAA